jgi:hypothetical protein
VPIRLLKCFLYLDGMDDFRSAMFLFCIYCIGIQVCKPGRSVLCTVTCIFVETDDFDPRCLQANVGYQGRLTPWFPFHDRLQYGLNLVTAGNLRSRPARHPVAINTRGVGSTLFP